MPEAGLGKQLRHRLGPEAYGSLAAQVVTSEDIASQVGILLRKTWVTADCILVYALIRAPSLLQAYVPWYGHNWVHSIFDYTVYASKISA